MVPGEDLIERDVLEEVGIVEDEVVFGEVVGDGTCVCVLEVCGIVVVELELEVEAEDLSLVVVSLFEEVTGFLDETVIEVVLKEVVLKEVVTVFGVREVSEVTLAEFVLLSLLDRL